MKLNNEQKQRLKQVIGLSIISLLLIFILIGWPIKFFTILFVLVVAFFLAAIFSKIYEYVIGE